MSVFMIETDLVSSTASSMDILSSEVSNLSSSVNGYDTSCEEFDFSSVKSLIASNLDACSIKISNTSGVLNSVVSSHTNLQNSLQFESTEEKAAKEAAKQQQQASTGSGSNSGSYNYSGGSSGSSGGGYYGGGGYTAGVGGSYISLGSVTETQPVVTTEEKEKAISMLDKEVYTEEEARQRMVDLAETQLGNKDESEYVKMFQESEGTPWCSEFVAWCADQCGYTDAGIIPKFADAESGVAWFKKNGQFKDRSYTPKAGDIIFVGGDSPTHTAMVVDVKDGKILTIEGNVGDEVKRGSYDIGSSRIYGFGTPNYGKVVIEQPEEIKSAVEWAQTISKDDTYGYGTDTESSKQLSSMGLVTEAYKKAGIKIEMTDIKTYDKALEKAGFVEVTDKVDLKTGKGLQRGDVLWMSTEDGKGHTELATGYGKLVGSRGDKDNTEGDSSGEEISEIDYYNNNWVKVLRLKESPNKTTVQV